MQLTENFYLTEFTRSQLATRKNIKNIPNAAQIANLKHIAETVLQPARDALSMSLHISSGFRSFELNRAVGGASNSQHTTGEAVDIDCADNARLFNWIIENCTFDQLIWEHGDDKQPDWVHVSSVTDRPNRKQVLVALKVKGRTVYHAY